MKKFYLIAAAFLIANTALADGEVAPVPASPAPAARTESREEVRTVNSLAFDGDTVSGSYSYGGGCRKHTLDVSVTISEEALKVPAGMTPEKIFVSEIKLIDVVNTPEGDPCEAFITTKFSVPVKQLILNAVKEKHLDVSDIDVRFPAVRVRTWSLEE